MQRRDTAWDAARAAQRRPLRKPYKPVAPVGPQNREHMKLVDMNPIAARMTHADFRACKCGYIVCSCEPRLTRFIPHKYLRLGDEFSFGGGIVYVNANDPRVRGSAPSEGP